MNRKMATILIVCLSIIAAGLAIGAGYSTANYSEQGSAKWVIGGAGLTGELLIDADGTFHFEGATADDYETAFAVTDPTADRTLTLPDYTGGVPLVIIQGTASDVNNGTTTPVTITDANVVMAADWFSAGKALKFTIAGVVTGDNDKVDFTLYVADAAKCALSSTDAEGAAGNFTAEWTIYAVSKTAQRISGTLIADDGTDVIYVYDTDTQDFDAAGGVITIQIDVDNTADDIAVNYLRVEHWIK